MVKLNELRDGTIFKEKDVFYVAERGRLTDENGVERREVWAIGDCTYGVGSVFRPCLKPRSNYMDSNWLVQPITLLIAGTL
jgi:hypothetical protein